MKLILLMTEQSEKGLDIAAGWQDAGAPGVTIVHANGLYSLQQMLKNGEVELPRMLISMGAALAAALDEAEKNVLILLCACEDDLVDRLIAKTNDLLGDLTEAGHGALLVLPIEQALGIRRHS